jgi:hypothetical protein
MSGALEGTPTLQYSTNPISTLAARAASTTIRFATLPRIVITSRKKPESRRYAVTIIIPNRSTSVGASTDATTSAHGTAPEATITAAPMIATPVRSIRKPGTRPSASPT